MKIHKNMTNLEVVDLLDAAAASYKLKDEEKNRFKIIAYERAAAAVEHLSSEVKDLWDEGKLTEISGIGKSIESHLDEIFSTGKSTHFRKLMKDLPPAMFELIKISGIGAKSAYKLTKNLGIINEKDALHKFEQAIEKGKIRQMEGFGEQSETIFKKSIKELKGRKKRYLLPYATKIAEEVIAWMKECKHVKKIDTLGSLRRKVSTVGDIDIAVSSNNPKVVIDHFVNYPKTNRIIEKGEVSASIILPSNVQVDLMVQKIDSYGSLLIHFTGSKHHNIALREFAKKENLSLSEYGIRKKIKNNKKTKLLKFKNEDTFYKYLKLKWIPPELREDSGEIKASFNNKLPNLVKLTDIKTDLQIHSDFDIETSHDIGESSVEEIVEKANKLKYEYIALTEHNPSKSKNNEKQIINLLKKKKEYVDKINYSLQSKKESNIKYVFNSLEIDILPDGKLPVSDRGLEILDFALVSIHSSFGISKEKMTERILDALSHPKVLILAHPTARKLNERESIEIDWIKVFEFCLKNKKIIEINADPMRLDLPDFLVKDAIEKNVMLSIGTDAHHISSMDNMVWGVSVARRGWAEKSNIVNTYSLDKFKHMLKLNSL